MKHCFFSVPTPFTPFVASKKSAQFLTLPFSSGFYVTPWRLQTRRHGRLWLTGIFWLDHRMCLKCKVRHQHLKRAKKHTILDFWILLFKFFTQRQNSSKATVGAKKGPPRFAKSPTQFVSLIYLTYTFVDMWVGDLWLKPFLSLFHCHYTC